MLVLSQETYAVDTPMGYFVLTYRGLLRLDVEISRVLVADVMDGLCGGRSFEEATENLSAQQRRSVFRLARVLSEHGALVSPGPGSEPVSSSGWDQNAHLTSGGQQLEEPEQYRKAVVVGSGTVARALVAALMESGAGEVRLVPPDSAVTPDGVDLAVFVAGGANTKEGEDLLASAWATAGGPCVQVARGLTDGYWTPPHTARDGFPVVSSALARASALDATAGTPTAPSIDTVLVADETFDAILAKTVAHDIWKYATRTPSLTSGNVKILDRRTLSTTERQVSAHPYHLPACQVDSDQFQRELAGFKDGPALTHDQFVDRWRTVSDDRVGAVTTLSDEIWEQLPLRTSSAVISDPVGLLAFGGLTVAGAGTTAQIARDQTRLRALAAYGSVMVDPRLLVDRHGSFLSAADADAPSLLRAVKAGAVEGFVRGVSLTSGQIRLVPVTRAFPVLAASSSVSYRVGCGTAAARSWEEAAAAALVQHCLRLSVEGPATLRRTRVPGVVDPRGYGDDPTIQFCLDMLSAAGLEPELSDITGPLGIPVVACTSGTVVVYGCGLDLMEATRQALVAMLVHFQSGRNRGLGAAWAATPEGCRTDTFEPAQRGESALTASRVADALQDAGYPPTVFALNHDPTVHQAMPYVVRVVVGDTHG